MNAGQARVVAQRWVAEEVSRSADDVLFAFTGGSINEMSDEDPFPPSSDLDLIVVAPKLDPARHPLLKRPFGGIPIEAVYLPRERFLSAEALLADFALGPQTMAGMSLFDPAGILQALRAAMAPEFAARHWLRCRCRALHDHALSLIQTFEASTSFVHLVGVALHAVRSMAQMALLADLRNPTVKRALVKARDVLAQYGLADEHGQLLRLAGAADLDEQTILRISFHVRDALDEACRYLRTPFIGSHMVSVHLRPSLELDVPACVASGCGPEIFVWIATLYVFSMIAIQNDAPAAVTATAQQRFRADMARAGYGTLEQARARMAALRPALGHMTAVCDDVIARNPRALG